MTGPDHYKEATRLLDGLQEMLEEVEDPKWKHYAALAAVAQIAQAHATLALADATYAVAGRTGGE